MRPITDVEDPSALRLALVERQRRFEWQLARDEQSRAAARLVAGKTHDLLNLVQIVQLASLELGRRAGDSGREFVDDLLRAATQARDSLQQLMALARPDPPPAAGAPIGPALFTAVAALQPLFVVELQLAAPGTTTTRCTAEELEHLVIGLVLDTSSAEVTLHVRTRTIDNATWLEIVRVASPAPGDRFELRVVEAIAASAGGELAAAQRRDGGEDLVVALPTA